jgi:hypothetical protein
MYAMNALRVFSCSVFIILLSVPLNAQQADVDVGPIHSVNKYLKACQNGDIEEIKHLITGPLYTKRRSLLNDNAGYSKFLINHFSGVEFSILSDTAVNESREVVVVERHYPDGTLLRTKLILVNQNEDTWKIYDEQLLSD